MIPFPYIPSPWESPHGLSFPCGDGGQDGFGGARGYVFLLLSGETGKIKISQVVISSILRLCYIIPMFFAVLSLLSSDCTLKYILALAQKACEMNGSKLIPFPYIPPPWESPYGLSFPCGDGGQVAFGGACGRVFLLLCAVV